MDNVNGGKPDRGARVDNSHPMRVLRRIRAPSPTNVLYQAQKSKVFGALFRKPDPCRFGRYVVLGELGRGGMGTVLRAYDDDLDRRVALKLLHTEQAEYHGKRLRREAQALAKLSHPNVVQVYEVGEVDGQPFVAMEFVQGQTLQQWAQQQPRPGWKASVEVYLGAGRGLAAVHAAGLVHRDFKPGNCIIDEEGRARVLDFGLVAQQAEVTLNDTDEPANKDLGVSPKDDALRLSLTHTGAVMGTIAYMSPEQLKGATVAALSDQFSFCVSLYEAVYGRRPFAGGSKDELVSAVLRGQVGAPPKGSRVPSRLRRALLRGLAVEPEQRWSSMQALLDELERIVRPKWTWWTGSVLISGTLAITGGALWHQTLVGQLCDGAEQHLNGVWDETRKQQVKAAILGTGLTYAPTTWDHVEYRLDTYSKAWVDKHVEVCEATSVRKEQSSEAMDVRMNCLHDRRTHLYASVQLLGHADAQVTQKAVNIVMSLPGLAWCDDLKALQAEVPPPEEPRTAEQVEAMRQQLAKAEAMQVAGKAAQALELAETVVKRAEVLGYMPLVAEAKLQRGSSRRYSGQYAEAEQDLKNAYALALEYEHDNVEQQTANELAFVVGYQQRRHEQGLQWGEAAVAVAKRHGDKLKLATSLNNLGLIFLSQGRYEQAQQYISRALEIREQILGVRHLDVANSLNNLGLVASSQGMYEQAEHDYSLALEIRVQALGAEHPDVATILNNLGSVSLSQGNYERAKRYKSRALDILEQQLGTGHPLVASGLNNLGSVFMYQGEYEQAEHYYSLALDNLEQALGADHPLVASGLNNLGSVLLSQGEYEQAERYISRALGIRENVLSADHPDIAASLNTLGSVFLHQEKYEQAERCYTRALEIQEQTLGTDHPNVARNLDNLGSVYYQQKNYKQAESLHSRALEMRERILGPEHPDVATSLNNLGSVYYQQKNYKEAERVYHRALKIDEHALGIDHHTVSHSLIGLAKVNMAQHKFDNARVYAERVVDIRLSSKMAPEFLADARFVLAQSLWPTYRERSRARSLAEKSYDTYTLLGQGRHKELAEVEQWLKVHRVR